MKEIKYKKCIICNKYFEETSDNFYIKNKTHLSPYCKPCEKAKNLEYSRKHPEKRAIYAKKDNNKPIRSRHIYEAMKKYREDGRDKEWNSKNKEKIKGYREKRNKYKKRTFTSDEWDMCLDYFKDNNGEYSCAYCGLPQSKHIVKYCGKEIVGNFHKEHVIHDGDNGIKNCVPSCKICNSKKNVKILDDWYNENNPIYSEERYLKIIKWITSDYKLAMYQ